MLLYLRDGSAQTSVCCHTETEVVDQTFYLILLLYTDTRPKREREGGGEGGGGDNTEQNLNTSKINFKL